MMKKILATDKLLHFSFSALIVLSVGVITGIVPAILIGLFIGLIKEAYDIKKSAWDWEDIYADWIGILYGAILLLI